MTMRTSLRSELPLLTLIAAMFVAAVLVWPEAPERIPIRWSFSGEVVGYGSKPVGLLGPPLISLGVYLVMTLVYPRIDPGRANYAGFREVYLTLRLAIVLLIGGFYGFTLLQVWGFDVEASIVAPVLLGMALIVFGNLLPKVRPNWFVGIRTPWTMSSKQSWNKTHRLGGRLFLLIGLVMVAVGFMGTSFTLQLAIAFGVGCSLFLTVYSYQVWRKDPEKIPPVGTSPDEER